MGKAGINIKFIICVELLRFIISSRIRACMRVDKLRKTGQNIEDAIKGILMI